MNNPAICCGFWLLTLLKISNIPNILLFFLKKSNNIIALYLSGLSIKFLNKLSRFELFRKTFVIISIMFFLTTFGLFTIVSTLSL